MGGRNPGTGFLRTAVLLLGALVCACADSTTDVPIEDNGHEEPFLTWPLPGADGNDWVINNYVDLAPGSSVRDYRGGTKVYDGHVGIDIDVPNFRWMDADFPVFAAAPGVVLNVHDGEFDRNVSCTGTWNAVIIVHADTTLAIYGHLKANSIRVSAGESVVTGQRLGSVGSSGCSTQPHLHFEMRDGNGAVVDPFDSGLWLDPPRYDTPLTFMDAHFQAGAISSVDQLKDPPPDIDAIAVGATLGVGVSMAGGDVGDQIRFVLTGLNGSSEFDATVTLDRQWRHTYWYWNVAVRGNPGAWTATISVNGNAVTTHAITVS